MEQQLTLMN